MTIDIALTRRGFVGTALVVGVGGLFCVPAAAVGSSDDDSDCTTLTTAWTLATSWDTPRGHHQRLSCHCNACRSHAANKVFATQSAAENSAHRAHPGCLCVAVPVSITTKQYSQLFASAIVVDRRTAVVAATLASTCLPDSAPTHIPASTPILTPGATTTSSSNPALPAQVSHPQQGVLHQAASRSMDAIDGAAEIERTDPTLSAKKPAPRTHVPTLGSSPPPSRSVATPTSQHKSSNLTHSWPLPTAVLAGVTTAGLWVIARRKQAEQRARESA